VLARVLVSGLARHLREGSVSLQQVYPRIVEIATAALWPVFAVLAVLSGPLISCVFGHQWVSAAAPLSLLALGLGIMMVNTFAWEIFIVCGQTRSQVRLELVRAPMGALFFCSLSFFGITAAACGRVLDAVFSQFLYFPHILRMTGTTLRTLGPIYGRNLLLTVVFILPAIVVMSVQRWPEILPVGTLVAVLGAGTSIWMAALIWVGHPLWVELRALLPARGR
jgi:O-antigen/teichoic acid export membrane protein